MIPQAQNADERQTVTEAAGRWQHPVLEPKLDGARLLVHVTETDVAYYTRSHKTKRTGRHFPWITAELQQFPADTWLDGELFSPHGWGFVNSILMTNDPEEAARKHSGDDLRFMAFDLLMLEGTDARSLPLRKRRDYLERLYEKFPDFWSTALVPQFPATEKSYQAMLDAGLEGAMVKNLDAPYASGKKGRGWTKVKPVKSDEFVVMGYEDGSGSWSGGVGKILIGQYRDGDLVKVGSVRPRTFDMRDELTADPEGNKGRVMEVVFQERTEDGRLRFPRFLRWRDDKPAEEVLA